MNDNDDGIALQSAAHPADEAEAEVLLARVVKAMGLAAESGSSRIADLRTMAVAAVNEVRQYDFEFHEAMEASIEAATEDAEIEVQGAFLSEAEVVALREMLANGASVTYASMAVLLQLKQRLGP